MRKVNQNYLKPQTSKIKKFRNTAYIALGSNKGIRANYIKGAAAKMSQNPKISLQISSSFYETRPYGNKNQPEFLNAVIKVKTSYDLMTLLDYLKQLEIELGRSKTTKWGPREIDLDLLFFNDEIIKNKKLTLPHQGIKDRDFVLVPLNEIAWDYFHPALKKKISDICIKDISKNIIRKTRLKIH